MISAAAWSSLQTFLDSVPRRYRLDAMTTEANSNSANPGTALAIAIERARTAKVQGHAPDDTLKHFFVDALARLIREAMHAESGDPAFLAMVLRHQNPLVRKYASLSAREQQDRRSVYAAVNAIAHPAKLERMTEGPRRDVLSSLQAYADSEAWIALHESLETMLSMNDLGIDASTREKLHNLAHSAALNRLCSIESLAPNEAIAQYRSLWDRLGPRQGSEGARVHGATSRQRGNTVEALAVRALEAVALRLGSADPQGGPYRVVSSLRVPASIPANHDRAKTEWDAVLLRRHAGTEVSTMDDDEAATWDVCLLLEAKASVEAATTDIGRLLRGIRLLTHADESSVYAFQADQGPVQIHGSSLTRLSADEPTVKQTVLYGSNAQADPNARLLNAASRMQLLSSPASVEFAAALQEGRPAEPVMLEPVWRNLLESPEWNTVLHQYQSLRLVRELMVNIADLEMAANHAWAQAQNSL